MSYPMACCARTTKQIKSSGSLVKSLRNHFVSIGGGGSPQDVAPSTYSNTDYLTISFSVLSTSTPAAPTGWTKIAIISGMNVSSAIYYRAAASFDGNPVSFANPAGAWTGVFCAWINVTGLDSVTPTSTDSGLTQGTSLVAPTITPNGTGRILVSHYSTKALNNITVPGSQTGLTRGQATYNSVSMTTKVGYEILSGSGATGTRTATGSTSVTWTASNVILN